MPIADVAGLYIAIERGFFKEEGLTVKPKIINNGAEALPQLHSGALDVIIGNYFTFLSATERSNDKFRFIADIYQSKPDVFQIVVPKDSTVQTVKDLKGKRIAIASLNSIGELAVANALRTAGLHPREDVKWVPMPFPQMPAALKNGSLDALWLTEPFLTGVQQEQGARKVTDTMTGAMADFPIAGWVTLDEWTRKYPKTMAALQRGLLKGQQIAASDRKAVEKVLPTYTQIKPEVASVITLGSFPTTLTSTRIQRVADLMQEFGYLTKKLDVKPLLAPLPQ
ncbi:NitT/TauT family transport system substrate-binding protein [Sphaerisporangium siamense]|uniref:NitT/TauT family transport system substrate-binding protein n=2 Tax=Sphaerisporangium siamense TaxID=795645 RepID=A0A7W7GC07_9ACTN|nr:NitT/TauT family transport system substrate-binding protein [Sphaerisporangium siamense]